MCPHETHRQDCRSPHDRCPKRSPLRRAARGVLPWLLVFLGVTAAAFQALAADSPAATADDILRSIPRGSPAERGWWLYERARQVRDAGVALGLMRIVGDRYPDVPAFAANLWVVRYFAAAGDLTAAAAALPPTVPEGTSPPDRAQWAFWRQQLTGDRDVEYPEGHGGVTPWAAFGALAGIPHPVEGNGPARAALALEGEARRSGLLGPWVWRLSRGDHPWLLSAAEAAVTAPENPLAHSPERPAILALLADARNRTTSPRRVTSPGELRADRTFAVQVGAFIQESSARGLGRELGNHGFRAYLSQTTGEGGTELYRVRIGPCSNLAVAESLGVQLSKTLMLPYQIVEEEGTR